MKHKIAMKAQKMHINEYLEKNNNNTNFFLFYRKLIMQTPVLKFVPLHNCEKTEPYIGTRDIILFIR